MRVFLQNKARSCGVLKVSLKPKFRLLIRVSANSCRLHGKDQRSVGIIDCILTKGLSTISEGIPKG
jgi:hypothetical protein